MTDLAPLVFIVHDEQLYQTYAWLCAQAGVPCVRAEGGLHALTQLERSHASAIICDARLPDMQALELWNIVRSDPNTAQIHFFLLSNKTPKEFTSAFDHTLAREVCTPLALSQILAQAYPNLSLPPVLSGSATPELYCDSRTFSLSELIVWLNENQKTGHWLIKLGEASGYLVMQKGELVYGEFVDERGQGSLLAIMLESGPEKAKEVLYYALDKLPEGFPHNINMATRQLLVSATVSIDHLNAKIIG